MRLLLSVLARARGWRRRAVRGLVVAVLLVAAWVVPGTYPHPPLRSFAPSSTAVFDRDGKLLRLTLAADEQYRLWTPLERISPQLQAALLLHEDRGFAHHPGVDPLALLRAAVRTAAGGPRQGGSTVTMQLARLLYRLHTRSVPGKLRQIGLALWLERCYSKHDLLEAHLNLAPYGRNVQGVGAASLIYFGKTPDRLTLAEALSLAVIPQAPESRHPETRRREGAGEAGQRDDGRPAVEPEALRAARLRLLRRWVGAHPTAPADVAAAQQPLRFGTRRQLPFAAPHLTTALLAAREVDGWRAPTPSDGDDHALHTTVDSRLQRLVEEAVQRHVAQQRPLGVRNAAAMLVDSRSNEVLALVGSADFFAREIAGQVNGAFARRSPGSALKPFIYALAVDQGLIHPATVLTDAPTRFGPWSPENFDGAFMGPLSARDALVRSRNVPAVALASRLAQPSFHQFLRSAGIADLRSERHYGLALALGGGEVTMEELVTLYAMLARGGTLLPLRYQRDAGDDDVRQARGAGVESPGAASLAGPRLLSLLSPEACFLVLSMLRDNPRPDHLEGGPPAAWKTGTSWGFRDAWSVGVVGPYVLAVWVGNFDGSGNPALVGAQVAAPLFFRIADGLAAAGVALPDPLLQPPPGVVRVEVCAASGDLPNADCPQTVPTWFIPGKSPIRVSTVHQRLAIDTRSGRLACPGTPARFVRRELFELWPSDVQRLFALAGMPRREVPTADCGGGAADGGTPPAITSPIVGATYQLRASRRDRERLALAATASAGVRTLYWFAGNAYLGSSRPSAALDWRPATTGAIALTVVDDRGQSATRTVELALVP